MKKILSISVCFSLLIGIMCFPVCAKASSECVISPALYVIAENSGMVKSGLLYSGITFDAGDFDRACGAKVSSITVKSLPAAADGKLMLGSLYVVENQIISRSDFSRMKFVPSGDKEKVSSFDFEIGDSGYSVCCELKILSGVNFAPSVSSGSVGVWTQKNISCFGYLYANDPEGDALTYEIVSYPEKGLVEITDSAGGDFRYTPYDGAKGKDSFSYAVRDVYGNYSEEKTVGIKIEKLKTNLVFDDMDDSPAHNEALILASKGIMDCEEKDGKVLFRPDEKISREDFLCTLMDALGAQNVKSVTKTIFNDDADISANAKGYITTAYNLGIIKGEIAANGRYFYAKNAITKSEAAVMINNIIGAKPSSTETSAFADENEIPAWSRSSVCALNELGIFGTSSAGKINACAELTRADAAKIIYSVLEYAGKV